MNTAESLRRIFRSVGRVSKTRYPGFLLGRPVSRSEIPIFIYHDVSAEHFENDLRFLDDNGYRTLSLDEYLETVGSESVDRCVLLTFDDARANFWEVAYPLLRTYSAHATLFVPTAWVGQADHPSIDDGIVPSTRFMDWEQLRECAGSGYVDIESHAHRHALVYTSGRIQGFATPQTLAQYDIYDWPMRRQFGRDLQGFPPLGTPVYQATPLLSADWRLLEDERTTAACLALVDDNGGGAFFDVPGWQGRLLAEHKAAEALGPGFERLPDQEFHQLVASELEICSEIFIRELGTKPRALAYPWMVGSRRSIEIATDMKFQAIFGVGLDFRHTTKHPEAAPIFGRYKGDWLRFLPGRNRLRLSQVLPEKILGFVKQQHLSH